MSLGDQHQPSVKRWYIDTRNLTARTSTLPLLETLQESDQQRVQKYYHLADRHMCLASYLLKYLYIHRACRVAWPDIRISLTPPPHHRPCFSPCLSSHAGAPRIDFNISHQASMVVFAGTTIYSPNPTPVSNPALQPQPQLGIDVTCVDERSRRGTSNVPQTGKELADFVDIFAEVFSVRELDAMKSGSCRGGFASEAEAVKAGLRLFYTYWALKEAYIKMTGEALLAKWLTRLEFVDVVAPAPAPPGSGPWGEQYTGIKTLWYGVEKEEARLEVVAFEEDYIVATAARGGGVGPGSEKDRKRDPWEVFEGIDIERDVASCARGRCRCLEG